MQTLKSNRKQIFLKCIKKNFYHTYIHMVVENYTKDLKESIYHGAVVSALAVGLTMLGKSFIKIKIRAPISG